MTELPINQHVTYQLQHRKCGKISCSTCRSGQGHGPYWYAYWREGSRLRSGYVGKISPKSTTDTPLLSLQQAITPVLTIQEHVAKAVLV